MPFQLLCQLRQYDKKKVGDLSEALYIDVHLGSDSTQIVVRITTYSELKRRQSHNHMKRIIDSSCMRVSHGRLRELRQQTTDIVPFGIST